MSFVLLLVPIGANAVMYEYVDEEFGFMFAFPTDWYGTDFLENGFDYGYDAYVSLSNNYFLEPPLFEILVFVDDRYEVVDKDNLDFLIENSEKNCKRNYLGACKNFELLDADLEFVGGKEAYLIRYTTEIADYYGDFQKMIHEDAYIPNDRDLWMIFITAHKDNRGEFNDLLFLRNTFLIIPKTTSAEIEQETNLPETKLTTKNDTENTDESLIPEVEILEVEPYKTVQTKIIGNVPDRLYSRGTPVEIQITNPVGEKSSAGIMSSKQGKFEYPMLFNSKSIIGKYEILVVYKDEVLQKNIIELIKSKISLEKMTSSKKIPEWVKNNVLWWSDGLIDDQSFIQGIQFLIKEGVMTISSTEQKTVGNNNEIPSWVRNNAKWWVEGQISEDDFLKGIEFLVKDGIISVEQTSIQIP